MVERGPLLRLSCCSRARDGPARPGRPRRPVGRWPRPPRQPRAQPSSRGASWRRPASTAQEMLTCLHVVAEEGVVEVADILLNHKAKLDVRDKARGPASGACGSQTPPVTHLRKNQSNGPRLPCGTAAGRLHALPPRRRDQQRAHAPVPAGEGGRHQQLEHCVLVAPAVPWMCTPQCAGSLHRCRRETWAVSSSVTAAASVPQYGWTALIYASANGYERLVEILIMSGAEPHHRTKVGGHQLRRQPHRLVDRLQAGG